MGCSVDWGYWDLGHALPAIWLKPACLLAVASLVYPALVERHVVWYASVRSDRACQVRRGARLVDQDDEIL